MPEDKEVQKSIIEQIYEEMLHILEECGDFDKIIIQKLTNLVNTGQLKKENPVYSILQSTQEYDNENS